jgi:ribosomal-protein-alanine N-acetyltransferase
MEIRVKFATSEDVPRLCRLSSHPALDHLGRSINCIILEMNGKLVGYLIYKLKDTSFNILHVFVHARYRKLNLATRMVGTLMTKLSLHRRRRIIVRVPERNTAAVNLFNSCGFRATKVIRQYYGEDEDAYKMEFEWA